MKHKTFFVIIIISVIVLVVFSFLNQEYPAKSLKIDIQEDMAYDYLCLETSFDKNSDPSTQGFCFDAGFSWVEVVGLSYYLNENSDNNDLRFFIVKIPIPELPKSTYFLTTEISKADLILNTRYNAEDYYDKETTKFSISYYFCPDVNWREDLLDYRLSCVGEYNNINSKPKNHYGLHLADNLQEIKLDIIPHLEFAKENNINEFTEILSFNPESVIDSKTLDNEIYYCLERVDHVSERRKCVEQYQLDIISSEYRDWDDLQPHVIVEHKQIPTPITKAIHTISLVLVPSLTAAFIAYEIRSKNRD